MVEPSVQATDCLWSFYAPSHFAGVVLRLTLGSSASSAANGVAVAEAGALNLLIFQVLLGLECRRDGV